MKTKIQGIIMNNKARKAVSFCITVILVILAIGCATKPSTKLSKSSKPVITTRDDFENFPLDIEINNLFTGVFRWQSEKGYYEFNIDGTGYYNVSTDNTGIEYRASDKYIVIRYLDTKTYEVYDYSFFDLIDDKSIPNHKHTIFLDLNGTRYGKSDSSRTDRKKYHLKQALFELTDGEYIQAINNYNEAIRICSLGSEPEPDNTYYKDRAIAYLLLGDEEKGIADTQTALNKGLPEEKLEDFKNLIRFTLEDRRVYYKGIGLVNNTGLYKEYDGKYKFGNNESLPKNQLALEEALKIFNALITKYPEFSAIYWQRFKIYMGLQQYDKALAAMNEYLVRFQNSYIALWERAVVHSLMGNIYASAADFIEVQKKYPYGLGGNSTTLQYLMMETIDNAKRLQVNFTPEALAEYNRKVAANPNNINDKAVFGGLLLQSAKSYMDKKDYANGIAAFREAGKLGFGITEFKAAWEAYCKEKSLPLPDNLKGNWKAVFEPARSYSFWLNTTGIDSSGYHWKTYEDSNGRVYSDPYRRNEIPKSGGIVSVSIPEKSVDYYLTENTCQKIDRSGGLVYVETDKRSTDIFFYNGKTIELIDGTVLTIDNGKLIENGNLPYHR